MRKSVSLLHICALILFSFTSLFASGQEIVGNSYNNYLGVNGITANPASIASSRYKVHFNLFTVSTYAGSNLYEFNSKAFYKFKFDNWKENREYHKINEDNLKKGWTNIDILGPSLLLNLNKKSALGITTRFRTMVNAYNFSNGTFNLFEKPEASIYNKDFNEKDVKASAHSFADIGLTYARILKQEGKHFLKGGFTLKYIQGISAARVQVDNLNINLRDANGINKLNGKGALIYAENIDRWTDENAKVNSRNEINMRNGSIGLDLGAVYEIRSGRFQPNPDHFKSKYRLIPYDFRFSFALTDIGLPVKYKTGTQSANYSVTADNITKAAIQKKDDESMEEYLRRLQLNDLIDKNSATGDLKMALPASARANIDWHIAKQFFINADALVSLRRGAKSKTATPAYLSTFSLTPRFESQWFGISTPLSIDVQNQFNWGAGLRLGPVIVGSHSLFSNLMKTNFRNIDAYAGLSIPIYQGERRKKEKKATPAPAPILTPEPVADTVIVKPIVQDKDGDGIPDEEDACPELAGLEKFKGCPDTDGDGVADHEDKCPTVAGVLRYDGCPVPDTDGDGVNDEEDKCPNQPGTASNQGCPEIKEEIKKTVERTAKHLFFVFGKATIAPKSYPALDELATIMQEDPTLLLDIEGHTDDVGSDESNLKLSQQRADAAKQYLVKKGISEERMTTIGYGESKPIAPNTTAEGRSKNRRIVLTIRNH